MPDPLAAAAEAVVAEHEANGFDYLSVLDSHLIALRAALAAQRHRDERAEAAVAVMEAEARLLELAQRAEAYLEQSDDFTMGGYAELVSARVAAKHEVDAARRRWAEVEGRRA